MAVFRAQQPDDGRLCNRVIRVLSNTRHQSAPEYRSSMVRALYPANFASELVRPKKLFGFSFFRALLAAFASRLLLDALGVAHKSCKSTTNNNMSATTILPNGGVTIKEPPPFQTNTNNKQSNNHNNHHIRTQSQHSAANDVLKLFSDTQPLDAIFRPKSVALVGASEKPGSVGRTVLWNLL